MNYSKNTIDKINQKSNRTIKRIYEHEQRTNIKYDHNIRKLKISNSTLNCNKQFSILTIMNQDNVKQKMLFSHKCHNRNCAICQHFKANDDFFKLQKLIKNVKDNHKEYEQFFITFTLPNIPFEYLANYRYYSKFQNLDNDFWKMKSEIRRQFKRTMKGKYHINLNNDISKVEWTNNYNTREMNIHFHDIIAIEKKHLEYNEQNDKWYIPKSTIELLKQEWLNKVNLIFKTNLENIVINVKTIQNEDINNQAGELAKYVSKDVVFGLEKNELIEHFEIDKNRYLNKSKHEKLNKDDLKYRLELIDKNIIALKGMTQEELTELEIRQRLFIKGVHMIQGAGLYGQKEYKNILSKEEQILLNEPINKFLEMNFYDWHKENGQMKTINVYRAKSIKGAVQYQYELELKRYEESKFKEKDFNYKFRIYDYIKSIFVNKAMVISIKDFNKLWTKITKDEIPINLKEINIKQLAEEIFFSS